MAKVTIKLHGKDYSVNCAEGEEQRLADTVAFIESKMQDIDSRSNGTTELRLYVLTCITMADELLELRRAVTSNKFESEDLFVAAIEHLKERVNSIAAQIEAA